jgi:hypothetical protein
MNGQYNIWNKWDPLKTVMLGDCYPAEFFRDIKNNKIRSALTQIADETQEDLAYYESVLKDFGCEVIRPELDPNDSIMNYIDENGVVSGQQGVPKSPLQPRDEQLVIGNNLFYTGSDHHSIRSRLDQYNNHKSAWPKPISKQSFDGYRGNDAPDWPTYDEYFQRCINNLPISDNIDIDNELNEIHYRESENSHFPIPAPNITVVGTDIYVDADLEDKQQNVYLIHYINFLKNMYPNFRINLLNIGGHSDGCFHTIKEGAILSLYAIQNYKDTFPGWDTCYLPDQSWSKVDGFLKLKTQVGGKWWVPDQEDNDEFTNFVETWLHDWVGYVEETVFDVNVLVLDEHHVCVNNMNPAVIKFLKKHNMEPVHVPWRHRYFWDGGLHCITLDLYRDGVQQDYFPKRTQPITDKGF